MENESFVLVSKEKVKEYALATLKYIPEYRRRIDNKYIERCMKSWNKTWAIVFGQRNFEQQQQSLEYSKGCIRHIGYPTNEGWEEEEIAQQLINLTEISLDGMVRCTRGDWRAITLHLRSENE